MSIDEPVTVREHDANWSRHGAELRRSLEAALAGLDVDVAHIGSTAVEGMAAKPIIDMQVGSPLSTVERVIDALVIVGFEHVADAGVTGREYLRRRDEVHANVHVVERGGKLWDDNIAFRDFLRSNPEAASRYERAKKSAALRAPTLLAYSDAKAEIVAALLAEARAR